MTALAITLAVFFGTLAFIGALGWLLPAGRGPKIQLRTPEDRDLHGAGDCIGHPSLRAMHGEDVQ